MAMQRMLDSQIVWRANNPHFSFCGIDLIVYLWNSRGPHLLINIKFTALKFKGANACSVHYAPPREA